MNNDLVIPLLCGTCVGCHGPKIRHCHDYAPTWLPWLPQVIKLSLSCLAIVQTRFPREKESDLGTVGDDLVLTLFLLYIDVTCVGCHGR